MFACTSPLKPGGRPGSHCNVQTEAASVRSYPLTSAGISSISPSNQKACSPFSELSKMDKNTDRAMKGDSAVSGKALSTPRGWNQLDKNVLSLLVAQGCGPGTYAGLCCYPHSGAAMGLSASSPHFNSSQGKSVLRMAHWLSWWNLAQQCTKQALSPPASR